MKTFLPLLLAILSTPYVLAAGDTWLPPSRADVARHQRPRRWLEDQLERSRRIHAGFGPTLSGRSWRQLRDSRADPGRFDHAAQPELVCYDAAGREIPVRSSLEDAADNDDHRLAVVPPRATGPPRHGHGSRGSAAAGADRSAWPISSSGPKKIDPYETGRTDHADAPQVAVGRGAGVELRHRQQRGSSARRTAMATASGP